MLLLMLLFIACPDYREPASDGTIANGKRRGATAFANDIVILGERDHRVRSFKCESCRRLISRPWILKFVDYKDFGDYYLPSKGFATWQYPDCEFDYFIAYVKDFKYNIKTEK